MGTRTSQIRQPIDRLDIQALTPSEPVNVEELAKILITLANKLNEVIDRLNMP